MDAGQAKAVRGIVRAVIDAAIASEPFGAPGGHIYAALMGQGCTLQQYESLMGSIQRAGLVERSGECYKATDAGRRFQP